MKLYAVSVSASFPDGPASSGPPHPSLDRYLHLVDFESQTKIRGFRLIGDARRKLLLFWLSLTLKVWLTVPIPSAQAASSADSSAST